MRALTLDELDYVAGGREPHWENGSFVGYGRAPRTWVGASNGIYWDSSRGGDGYESQNAPNEYDFAMFQDIGFNMSTLSPSIADMGINAVWFGPTEFQHVKLEHANQDQIKGAFWPELLSSPQMFINLILEPALETGMARSGDTGEKRVTAYLPAPIGVTGTYGGQPNEPTNKVEIILREVSGLLGIYAVGSIYPVR